MQVLERRLNRPQDFCDVIDLLHLSSSQLTELPGSYLSSPGVDSGTLDYLQLCVEVGAQCEWEPCPTRPLGHLAKDEHLDGRWQCTRGYVGVPVPAP